MKISKQWACTRTKTARASLAHITYKLKCLNELLNCPLKLINSVELGFALCDDVHELFVGLSASPNASLSQSQSLCHIYSKYPHLFSRAHNKISQYECAAYLCMCVCVYNIQYIICMK